MNSRRRPLVYHPAIFDRWVRGRVVVYADNNFWIDLADGKTRKARQCRDVCVEAVDAGVAIFPVTAAGVEELLDQPDEATPRRQAWLMDRLGRGVCFRAAHCIWDLEARATLDVYPARGAIIPDRRQVFTHVFEYISDAGIEFQPEWEKGDINTAMRLFREALPPEPLTWLLEHVRSLEMVARHRVGGERYVQLMGDSIQKNSEHFRRPDGKLDRERMLLEEHLWAFKNVIMPAVQNEAIERFGPEGAARFFADVGRGYGEGSAQRLRALMLSMPALELFGELMAGRTTNPRRKVRPEDRLDVDHAGVAPAYADYFVTKDRGLRDLLGHRCTVPKRRGCTILKGESDLGAALRTAMTGAA